jgi:predicted AAA+ superfamily ATPase
MASYFYPDYGLTFLQTKDGAEIDLVIDRPGKSPVFIEIKSAQNIDQARIRTLESLIRDIPEAEAYCLSRDKSAKQWGRITALPWEDGLAKILPPRFNNQKFPKFSHFESQ